jgi:hypothetical protein
MSICCQSIVEKSPSCFNNFLDVKIFFNDNYCVALNAIICPKSRYRQKKQNKIFFTVIFVVE